MEALVGHSDQPLSPTTFSAIADAMAATCARGFFRMSSPLTSHLVVPSTVLLLTVITQRLATAHPGHVVARCDTAYPLDPRFATGFGTSMSEATMRPSPTMRLETTGPRVGRLNEKRQSSVGGSPESSKRMAARKMSGWPKRCKLAYAFLWKCS